MKTYTIPDSPSKLSIDEQLSLTVKKSNDLVRESRYQLSAKELTCVDFMISKYTEAIKKHKKTTNSPIDIFDIRFLQIETTIAEINEVCNFGEGGKNHKSTEEALINLSLKKFDIITEDNWRTFARWLEKPMFKNGRVKLQLDKDLISELPALEVDSDKYTQYYFRDSVSLKQIDAKRLYEFMRSFDSYDALEVPKTKLMTLLQKEHLEWPRFTKYLKNAVNAINEHTSMKLSYQTIKEGRETVAVRFTIRKREYDSLN